MQRRHGIVGLLIVMFAMKRRSRSGVGGLVPDEAGGDPAMPSKDCHDKVDVAPKIKRVHDGSRSNIMDLPQGKETKETQGWSE